MALQLPVQAQTLAHPGWVGNGVNIEPWWKRAVFYRIDPTRFQAMGDGKRGELGGVLKRMDYIQSLGVDAIILITSGDTSGDTSALSRPDGFDDISRAAVDAHLRALVELGAPASQSAEDDAQYLGLARAWLNQGAAGLYIPTAKLAKIDGTAHIANLLQSLRALTNSFPGERVLLADAAPASDTGGQDQDLVRALAKETQLTAGLPFHTDKSDAASLRGEMLATPWNTAGSNAAQTNLLLVADRAQMLSDERRRGDGPDEAALQRAMAAMLLASRGAVVLDYGQELGLIAPGKDIAPLMQWTPGNVTPKATPPAEPVSTVAATPADSAPSYGGFTAFIPPLPRNMFPPPKMPEVVMSDNPLPRNVDPNMLPGFTDGELDTSLSAMNGATANVAMENGDVNSLLNLYRHLIQLHHGNPALRNGGETVLDHNSDSALVWVRHGAAGSTEVVVVCNLSTKAFTLDLAALHLKSGTARVLLGATALRGIEVAAGAVFVGEVR